MDELRLLYGLQHNDANAFQALQHEYSEDLIIFAYMLLHDAHKSEEVVERFLTNLYKENEFAQASLPLHAFLYKKLRKECETEIWNSYAGPENS